MNPMLAPINQHCTASFKQIPPYVIITLRTRIAYGGNEWTENAENTTPVEFDGMRER
jgi:hypothetical protein